MKVVCVSGGFDPLHIGHIDMIREARDLGDRVVVILNNDNWLKAKKGYAFMPEQERKEILEALECVDEVVITAHMPNDPKDAYHRSVSRALEKIKPHIFANGGDRDEKNAEDPESSLYWDIKTCNELGIEMAYNIGKRGKIQSSSNLTANVSDTIQASSKLHGNEAGV